MPNDNAPTTAAGTAMNSPGGIASPHPDDRRLSQPVRRHDGPAPPDASAGGTPPVKHQRPSASASANAERSAPASGSAMPRSDSSYSTQTPVTPA
ncbi:hypothetical protein Asera_30830 [Actinocatenispora sera]|uniref:Uncharacterized protein n=1 Tax=Actinocatenispora sera TaxID=390989 RepID=A0A810L268_9ACTN|nr:hypothetical protein Asera_30830 [Actinocatenispora sera]